MRTPPLPDAFSPAERDRIRSRLGSLARRRLKDADGARVAAVLVPLVHHEGEPGVLFTKRSDTVGTHKGQVSFPGGMQDPTDEDFVHTALRELEEEIGIAQDAVEVLGHFHEARAITGVRVVPVVGFLGELAELDFTVSEAEIDTVFALTLKDLHAPDKRYDALHRRGRIPVFDAGPHPVWGLTAYILEEVLKDALGLDLPPSVRPPSDQIPP